MWRAYDEAAYGIVFSTINLGEPPDMPSSDYYEQIEETFEAVEVALESLPDDVDIRGAEGVINAANKVVEDMEGQPAVPPYAWPLLARACVARERGMPRGRACAIRAAHRRSQ